MAVQAVARGDAVVVIDPKGDDGLLSRIRREAGPRFRLFSPAHPELSVKYNPVGRYRDVREVADRVAALLPSRGDALPFRNFGWDIVHVTARALHGKRPMTLRNLKRFGIDRPIGPLASRPKDHHLKLASALLPALSKLDSDLLSPESGGLSWEAADRERLVVYLSLSSLLAPESAAAVGKMATLDLASFIGSRYAFSKGHGPIWLFVDELADVVTPEFVGLLGKSRAAGLRIVAAAQSAADLEAALGDRARARQALANVNACFQFRAQSADDAELFSAMAGRRLLPARSEGADYEPSLLGSGLAGVDDFRARFGERTDWREAPLVPPWALAELPVLSYFARWEGRLVTGPRARARMIWAALVLASVAAGWGLGRGDAESNLRAAERGAPVLLLIASLGVTLGLFGRDRLRRRTTYASPTRGMAAKGLAALSAAAVAAFAFSPVDWPPESLRAFAALFAAGFAGWLANLPRRL
jgi:hypothetical protein